MPSRDYEKDFRFAETFRVRGDFSKKSLSEFIAKTTQHEKIEILAYDAGMNEVTFKIPMSQEMNLERFRVLIPYVTLVDREKNTCVMPVNKFLCDLFLTPPVTPANPYADLAEHAKMLRQKSSATLEVLRNLGLPWVTIPHVSKDAFTYGIAQKDVPKTPRAAYDVFLHYAQPLENERGSKDNWRKTGHVYFRVLQTDVDAMLADLTAVLAPKAESPDTRVSNMKIDTDFARSLLPKKKTGEIDFDYAAKHCKYAIKSAAADTPLRPSISVRLDYGDYRESDHRTSPPVENFHCTLPTDLLKSLAEIAQTDPKKAAIGGCIIDMRLHAEEVASAIDQYLLGLEEKLPGKYAQITQATAALIKKNDTRQKT